MNVMAVAAAMLWTVACGGPKGLPKGPPPEYEEPPAAPSPTPTPTPTPTATASPTSTSTAPP